MQFLKSLESKDSKALKYVDLDKYIQHTCMPRTACLSFAKTRMGFCRHVLAPLLRSLSPQSAVDSGNSPVTARLQGHIRSAPRSVRFSWPSGVWRQFGDARGSSLNSSEICMLAVAHGNRTHRGRLSAPATGFEDRASHQIRTRYRGGI